MNEVVLVTSSKDLNGVALIDFRTGTSICPNLKNNVSDPGTVCIVGGASSYSGHSSSSSDYICIAQSKKPIINLWSWGKTQVQMQFHVQEIITSLASDRYGMYIIGGSKKGMIYIWEVATGTFLTSWQAHFKDISSIKCSTTSDYFVSTSNDGIARAWDLVSLLDRSGSKSQQLNFKQSQTPYRSWSPHTLPIKDAYISNNFTALRVFTCSLDRAVVVYDVHRGIQLLRVGLSESLESICCNPTQDFCLVGASNGMIFVLGMSIAASNTCNMNVQKGVRSNVNSTGGNSKAANSSQMIQRKTLALNTASDSTTSKQQHSSNTVSESILMTLIGHTRAITSLSISLDNCTLVSTSEDGSCRWWDIWTGQCLREIKPLNKASLSSAMIISRPEHMDLSVGGMSKPTLAPFTHLQKFTTSTNNNSTAGSSGVELSLAPQLLPRKYDVRNQIINSHITNTGHQDESGDANISRSRNSNNNSSNDIESSFVPFSKNEDDEEEEEEVQPVTKKAKQGAIKNKKEVLSHVATESLPTEVEVEDEVHSKSRRNAAKTKIPAKSKAAAGFNDEKADEGTTAISVAETKKKSNKPTTAPSASSSSTASAVKETPSKKESKEIENKNSKVLVSEQKEVKPFTPVTANKRKR